MKDKHCVNSRKHWTSPRPRTRETGERAVRIVTSITDLAYCLPQSLLVSLTVTQKKKEKALSPVQGGLVKTTHSKSLLSLLPPLVQDATSSGPEPGKLQESAAVGRQWRLPRLSAVCLQTTLVTISFTHSPSPGEAAGKCSMFNVFFWNLCLHTTEN